MPSEWQVRTAIGSKGKRRYVHWCLFACACRASVATTFRSNRLKERQLDSLLVLMLMLMRVQDIGGNDIQKQEIREAVELPLTQHELYKQIGIDPPRGVLLWGPPGTGKTMLAKAVAHHTTAAFIRVVGSEFVQKYLGEVRLAGHSMFQAHTHSGPHFALFQ